MKLKLWHLLLLLGAVFTFAACSDDGRGFEELVISKRTARGASAILQNSNSQGLPVHPLESKVYGEITGSPQEVFQNAAIGFLQTTLSPTEVGTISGIADQTTGIRFWGSVELEQGFINSDDMDPVDIALDQSQLRIAVWDSFAGTTDVNGNRLPEIAVHFSEAHAGSVAGNEADISFQDSYGRVRILGTFDADFFEGTITYTNFTSFSSSVRTRGNPEAETLGTFRVRTCGFFRCE